MFYNYTKRSFNCFNYYHFMFWLTGVFADFEVAEWTKQAHQPLSPSEPFQQANRRKQERAGDLEHVWEVVRGATPGQLTLSSTTSLMGGSPSGFCMQAGMNWKPSRKSLSYWRFPPDSVRSAAASRVSDTGKEAKKRDR